MAARSARKGFSLLASSISPRASSIASRIPGSRTFTASPISSAFATKPVRAATTATSSPSKSAASATSQPTVTPKSAATSEPPPPTARSTAADTAARDAQSQRSLTDGLADQPAETEGVPAIDWTRSYHGLGGAAFTPEQQDILLAPIAEDDVEVKPDGLLYLPEIKYRRILNRAFGPGGWGLAPRGESIVTGKLITREYGLVVQGRLVSIARGEQGYFDPEGIPTATEGCKSNALMRCCKDLGIASELWDPRYIRKFMAEKTKEIWVEHVVTKKKKKITIRKDDTVRYPFKESTSTFKA